MVRRVLEQVRGSPNLMKDPISQVVLNTNESEFEMARQRKLARKQNVIKLYHVDGFRLVELWVKRIKGSTGLRGLKNTSVEKYVGPEICSS